MTPSNVLVFCPTYKVDGGQLAMEPETLSKIHRLNFSEHFDVEIGTDNPYPPPDNRNVLHQYQKARQMALEGGYDALLTVEHDILVPPDALQMLWDTGAPVAYGIYLFRGYRNIANVYRLHDIERPNMVKYRKKLGRDIQDGVMKTNGAGMGCLLIRRAVLKRIEFRTTTEMTAPDFPFAQDCEALGIKQVAHFGVQCGHIIKERALYLDTRYAQGSKRPSTVNQRPWVKTMPILERLQIAIFNRRGKADGLKQALMASGHNVVSNGEDADALLIDHDMNQYSFRNTIDKYYREGKPVFLYPHGAAPILSWDGVWEPYEAVTANLVTAPGQAEVMRRYGYSRPINIIGWYYCEQRPFQTLRTKQSEQGMNILFGPIHPMKGGSWSYPEDEAINRRTFERLLKVRGAKITVRYIGDLAANGLWEAPGVSYTQVKPTNDTADIDQADVVISNGTLAYLAIARGRPTIMLNQLSGGRDLVKDKVMQVANLDKYADYMRYPFDVEDAADLSKVIEDAGQHEPQEWKRLFIGQQLQPAKFCSLLGKLIAEQQGQSTKPQPVPVHKAQPARRIEKGIYYLHRHQGKEAAYIHALGKVGYRLVQTVSARLRFALGDLDGSRFGNGEVIYREWLPRMYKIGIPVFMYPHAARPMVQWDGLLVPWPHTRCTFVIAPGHAEVMKRFGYQIRTEVIGWSMCGLRDFQPVQEMKNVLFGPIHPAPNGWLADCDIDINRRAFARLMQYCRESGASLTVRHIQPLERSGLTKQPGVKYIRARPNGSTAEIDAADLVIGHQTFAYLAIARGKPTLMMGEDTPPHSGQAASNLRFVEHWDEYADYLMYPLDILKGNTSDVVEQACQGSADQDGRTAAMEWRDKFIGEAFDPTKFVTKLESYL
ncbi:MAG: hypothetical protein A2W35_05375 [Chloroflexi bacterium RBG_16_57_11]|nr:MAG: hypothetical protein A2W35_05375 [Chloroflexi bacterium RBG_16_57_11]